MKITKELNLNNEANDFMKTDEHIEYVENGISNCCGALVELHSERCSECKEYCDTEKNRVMEYKNLHNINTFACSDNEIYLSGTDENGDDLTIVLNAIEVLQWLDMKYIKEQSIKYIKEL